MARSKGCARATAALWSGALVRPAGVRQLGGWGECESDAADDQAALGIGLEGDLLPRPSHLHDWGWDCRHGGGSSYELARIWTYYQIGRDSSRKEVKAMRGFQARTNQLVERMQPAVVTKCAASIVAGPMSSAGQSVVQESGPIKRSLAWDFSRIPVSSG